MGVLPGMKQKRREIGGFGEFFNPADKDGVVAGDMNGLVGNFKTGAAILEQWGTTRPRLPVQTGKAVYRPGGETI
jgi:hypothetical protein